MTRDMDSINPELNSVYRDCMARGAWIEAWRAVRAGDEECENPLLRDAWYLRHMARDPFTVPLAVRQTWYRDARVALAAGRGICHWRGWHGMPLKVLQ